MTRFRRTHADASDDPSHHVRHETNNSKSKRSIARQTIPVSAPNRMEVVGGSQKQRLISHSQEQRCCYPHVINTSANSRCEHEDGEQLLGSGRARSEVQWRGADGRRVGESVTDKTNTEKKEGRARMLNTPRYSTVQNVFQNNQYNTLRQSRENEKLRLKEDHF